MSAPFVLRLDIFKSLSGGLSDVGDRLTNRTILRELQQVAPRPVYRLLAHFRDSVLWCVRRCRSSLCCGRYFFSAVFRSSISSSIRSRGGLTGFILPLGMYILWYILSHQRFDYPLDIRMPGISSLLYMCVLVPLLMRASSNLSTPFK